MEHNEHEGDKARVNGAPARPDGAASQSNGERAGGDRHDVPGGAYNVPPPMADEVSEESALPKGKKPKSPER